MGWGVAALGLGTKSLPASKAAVRGASEKLLIKETNHPQPAPVGTDRLPLAWYKNTVKRLKDKVASKGVDVIVIEDNWNMTYFTGNFMTKTERPCFAVFPVKEDAIFWYSPGLDNELVKSWWCTL